MSAWDLYKNRISVTGVTKYDTTKRREVHNLNMKLPDSLSYHTIKVYEDEYSYNILMYDDDKEYDGVYLQNMAIINSDNLNEKNLYSMPGETIQNGSMIYWMDNYWIVTEVDYNSTIYTRAKVIQCNHLLKWVSDDGVITEQWCYVEDGTKYLTGEYEDRHFVVTRGDSRIAVTIPRNSRTVLLNRESRFLIDDEDSNHKLAYALTKPLKTGWVYKDHGVFKFVMQEVTSSEDDNHELGIADYYKYYSKYGVESVDKSKDAVINPDDNVSESTNKKVWL